MDTLLQQYLTGLKSSVSQMAGLVEEVIVLTSKALARKDESHLSRVFEIEEQINEFNKKIDRDCFKLLARQSPVAGDLRLIIVSTKMSMDLERMGDLACTISNCVTDYLAGQPSPVVNEIIKMSDLVRLMVRQALDSFVQNDGSLAREVLKVDETVDQYRDSLTAELRQALRGSVRDSDALVELFTIVRNLERIGDHATNIAEEIVFLIDGEDIRHQTIKELKRGGKV